MEIDPLGELEEALMDRTTASKNRKQRIFINRSTESSKTSQQLQLDNRIVVQSPDNSAKKEEISNVATNIQK